MVLGKTRNHQVHLGNILGHVGAVLGRSWPILAPILAHLAPLLAHPKPLLAHLGSEIPKKSEQCKIAGFSCFFGRVWRVDLASCRHLAHLGAILGLSWSILAPILAHLLPLLAHLAPLLAYLGASWVHLGTDIPKSAKNIEKHRFFLFF